MLWSQQFVLMDPRKWVMSSYKTQAAKTKVKVSIDLMHSDSQVAGFQLCLHLAQVVRELPRVSLCVPQKFMGWKPNPQSHVDGVWRWHQK